MFILYLAMMELRLKFTPLFRKKKIILSKFLNVIMESKIQSKIIAKLTQEGWLCVKLIRTNKNGIPDLICLKDGKTMFIEVKKESGKLSEIQKYRIEELKKQGFNVKVWSEYGTDFNW